MTGRLVSLDDPAARDPLVAGAKAAWLAAGRRAGLAVLPGLVVPADASRAPFAAGAEALIARGSGGARLVVAAVPLEDALASELATVAGRLGDRLVVRSSSRLEAGGEWAGAFTSYVDIGAAEVATALRGCWASAFGVDALRRFTAAGVEAGSAPMAVLIQPAVTPEAGGAARLDGEVVEIVGGLGSPVAVLQGWEPGLVAQVGPDGRVTGAEAMRVLGDTTIALVAAAVREAASRTGATAAEWALADGRIVLLQLGVAPRARLPERRPALDALRDPLAMAIGRLVRRMSRSLESLVLPWAIAAPTPVLDFLDASPAGSSVTWDRAAIGAAAARLTAQVWGDAGPRPGAVLADLRGAAPETALARIRSLPSPDLELARAVIAAIGGQPADRADPALGRRGLGRWEPYSAAVALANAAPIVGIPASGGLGAGRMAWLPMHAVGFRPRDVLVAPRPLPHLAPLLWDAAGVVTLGGGPGAHLFEAARALGIPAVTGIDGEALGPRSPRDVCLAVDGWTGEAFAIPF